MISNECRKESNESVDKAKRYSQIREILKANGQMTAKEVAVEMFSLGYVNSTERNWSAPRLTELETRYHLVKVVGKKKCKYTGKTGSVYELVENQKGWEQLKLEVAI